MNRRSRSLLGRTWNEFGTDHCSMLAASIAYYVLFSFLPLVTLSLAVIGVVLRDPQSRQNAIDAVLQTIPLQAGAGQNLIFDSIRNVSGQSGALSLVGVVGLLWASSGMFGAIRAALDIAWDTEPQPGFLRQKLIDALCALGLGVLLLASMVATVLVHSMQTVAAHSGTVVSAPMQSTLTLAGVLVPAIVTFVAFLLLYRLVPNVRHRVGDVWPGALLATVLFELGKHGFAYYVAHINRSQALYGSLGAFMLFMLWAYVGSIILLIGAELASEYERGRHHRPYPDESTAPPSPYAPRPARV
jgi:membrane protein